MKKKCGSCKSYLLLKNFYAKPGGAFGVDSTCNICKKKRDRSLIRLNLARKQSRSQTTKKKFRQEARLIMQLGLISLKSHPVVLGAETSPLFTVTTTWGMMVLLP